MAVCALTMLDGMEEEVTAAGGVLLLALALILAWLSTHVADRGDHILGTILTVGAHASLIGLGGHDSYSGGSPGADAPEQQTPAPSQENKPDDGEPGTERGGGGGGEGEGTGEGAEGVRADLLLDIQSKQQQAGRLHTSDEDEDEADEDDDDDDDELEEEDKKILKRIPVLPTTATATCISVRLKFLNDTEEVAVVEPQDTVGGLKRLVEVPQTERRLLNESLYVPGNLSLCLLAESLTRKSTRLSCLRCKSEATAGLLSLTELELTSDVWLKCKNNT